MIRLDNVLDKLRSLDESNSGTSRLPTQEDVSNAERDLGVTFHPDYRRFLLTASNVTFGILEPAVVSPEPTYRNLIKVARCGWKIGVPKDVLPICDDNSDFFCLAPDGSIHFWSHNGWDDAKWPNLADWISERWIEWTLEFQKQDDK